MLTVPIIGPYYQAIGVLQLINARDKEGNIIPFHSHQQTIIEAIANMAGVSYSNSLLQLERAQLFDSFGQIISTSLQHKSQRLLNLSQRLPNLIEKITDQLKKENFDGLHFDSQYLYEQKMALWIHKLNKLIQPTHITHKSSKLHMMSDRMEELRLRFALCLKDIELQKEKKTISHEEAQQLTLQLQNDLVFLESCNQGDSYISEEALLRIQKIATPLQIGDQEYVLLPTEISQALQIKRGTLSEEEHNKLEATNFITPTFLESLPISGRTKKILEHVGTPYSTNSPLCVRVLQFAQYFESLTSSLYQTPKKLSEIMLILGSFKRNRQIDPQIFDSFVSSNLFMTFAHLYLDDSLIDEVDTSSLLAIQPV